MSIEKPTDADLKQAYFAGLDSGFDVETAEDLGIPSTPETFARHLESAREAAAELAKAEAQAAREAAHQTNVDLYHLQTDGQRATTFTPAQEAAIEAAKQLTRQTIKPPSEQ